MGFFRHFRQRHFPATKSTPLDALSWEKVRRQFPLLGRLPSQEADDLLVLSDTFLADKYIEGVQGLVMTEEKSRLIALFACLPILKLGLDCYDDWNNIFVTPASFSGTRRYYQAGGVISEWEEDLSGEVMSLGPVALSWDDVRQGGQGRCFNVVIHEMAHKLDGRNGRELDGMPALTRSAAQVWQTTFELAYANFCRQVQDSERGLESSERQRLAHLPLDEYAAESLVEFFAVLCEAFFERPLRVRLEWPQVYACLVDFFQMDPATWI